MRLEARSISGERLVFAQLEPQLAMTVWYHLSLAQVDPLSTVASRQIAAPLISSLARCLVAIGYIEHETMNEFAKHLRERPTDAFDQSLLVKQIEHLEQVREKDRDRD